jgi:hypothetical protein
MSECVCACEREEYVYECVLKNTTVRRLYVCIHTSCTIGQISQCSVHAYIDAYILHTSYTYTFTHTHAHTHKGLKNHTKESDITVTHPARLSMDLSPSRAHPRKQCDGSWFIAQDTVYEVRESVCVYVCVQSVVVHCPGYCV